MAIDAFWIPQLIMSNMNQNRYIHSGPQDQKRVIFSHSVINLRHLLQKYANFNIKKKITLNYPKYNNVCSSCYGIFFLVTQEQVRKSHGKRAMSVLATEVLLYFLLVNLLWLFSDNFRRDLWHTISVHNCHTGFWNL